MIGLYDWLVYMIGLYDKWLRITYHQAVHADRMPQLDNHISMMIVLQVYATICMKIECASVVGLWGCSPT